MPVRSDEAATNLDRNRALAASPLYRVYENQFRFSPTTLTLLFTVYIVVLLATLLLFGSVSDLITRVVGW
jgi:hypothetical protein